jgi:hypothetical protein
MFGRDAIANDVSPDGLIFSILLVFRHSSLSHCQSLYKCYTSHDCLPV